MVVLIIIILQHLQSLVSSKPNHSKDIYYSLKYANIAELQVLCAMVCYERHILNVIRITSKFFILTLAELRFVTKLFLFLFLWISFFWFTNTWELQHKYVVFYIYSVIVTLILGLGLKSLITMLVISNIFFSMFFVIFPFSWNTYQVFEDAISQSVASETYFIELFVSVKKQLPYYQNRYM